MVFIWTKNWKQELLLPCWRKKEWTR